MPEHDNPYEGMSYWTGRAEEEARAGQPADAAAAAAIAQAYALWFKAIKN